VSGSRRDTGPGSDGARRRRRWLGLLPQFEERLTPEFYHLTGKLRFIAVCALIVFAVIGHLQVEELRLEMAAYWAMIAVQAPVHLLDALLALWIWRGRLSLANMQRASYACMALESATTLIVMWAYGSVTSHMLVFSVVLLFIYRLAYDFRMGLVGFAILFLGHWAIVIAEVCGWMPHQPLATGVLDMAYRVPARQIGMMVDISVMMLLAFAIAHWAVARLRFKEAAIRLLRESLYAAEPGRVGRHSGRTLRDTYLLGSSARAGWGRSTRVSTGGRAAPSPSSSCTRTWSRTRRCCSASAARPR
jgi:hypothetical protein